MKNIFSIYLVTNTVNGKRYVGQTSYSIAERWLRHQSAGSGCLALRSAIQKYGPEKFLIESLIEVQTKQAAIEIEQEYIQRYCTRAPNGYNLTDGGEGTLGIDHRGMKNTFFGKSHKDGFRVGHVVTDETKEKIGRAQLGNKKALGHIGKTGSSEQMRECGFWGHHVRWHQVRNVVSKDCQFCVVQ